MSLVGRILQRLRWQRRSAMVRLSLLLSVLFAVGFGVAIFVALSLGQRAFERRVDASLAALASAAVLDQARGESPEMILRPPDDIDDLPPQFKRAVERGRGTADLNNNYLRSDVWRVLVTKDANGVPVMVAVPLEDNEDIQELLAGILWSTAGIVVILTLIAGLGAGLLAQRRLGRIEHTLSLLAAGDLTARTGQTRRRDDIDYIAAQLDMTAAELERLVTQTRHLSASIAHDLRTPLARLRAQLEMLPEGEARGAALEEAERLSGIFDTIMRVARIEAAQGREGFTQVDLASLAEEMADIFGPVVEDSGKTLDCAITAPETIMADRQMLVQAIANLIQNAIVHGGPEITLVVESAAIGVRDSGAGVPPEQYDEIVKPMVRLDAARTKDGSGLGLALVRAVADRHGARLDMRAVTPRGFTVSLNFAKL